jgi:hypothetical protein
MGQLNWLAHVPRSMMQEKQSGMAVTSFEKQLLSQFDLPASHGQSSMQLAYFRHLPPAAPPDVALAL